MSKQFSIFGEIKVNTKSVKRDVKELGKELRNTTKQIDKAEDEAKRLGKTNATTARSFDRMREDTERFKAVLRRANMEYKRGDLTTKQYTAQVKKAAMGLSRVNGRLKDTSARMKDASKQTLGFSSKIGLAAAAGGLFAVAAARIGSALGDGIRELINYSSAIQQASIAFTTLTGSAAKAQEHIGELRAFAEKTPFDFAGLTKSSQMLQQAGLKTKEVIPLMKALGDTLAAGGKSQDDLNRAVLAFSQIQGASVLKGQEANQLVQAGIPIYKLLADQMGKTVLEVKEMGKAGELTAAKVRKFFQEAAEAKFAGAMEKQSHTFQGSVERIKESILNLAEVNTRQVFENITAAFDDLASKLQGASTFNDAGIALGEELGKGLGIGLANAVGELGNSVYKAIAGDASKKAGDDFLTAFERKFDKFFWEDAMGLDIDMTDTILDWLTNPWVMGFSKLLQDSRRAWNEFRNDIASNNSRLGQIARTLAMSLINPFAGMYSTFVSIGQRIPQGLINGMMSWVGQVASAAYRLATTAVAAAKGGVDVRSPSRVFHKIGHMIALGLANGITDNIHKPVRATETMIARMLTKLKPSKKNKAFIGYLKEIASLFERIGVTRPDTPLEKLQKLMSSKFFKRLDEGTKKLYEQALAVEILKEKYDAAAEALGRMSERLAFAGRQLERAGLDQPKDRSGTGTSDGGGLSSRLPGEHVRIVEPPPPLKLLSFWERILQITKEFRESLPSVREALQLNIADAMMSVGDVVANAFVNMEGGIKGFFKGIAQGFAQLAKQIIAQLIRILVYKAVFGIISAMAGGGFMAGFSNPGGVMEAITGGVSSGGGGHGGVSFGGGHGLMSGLAVAGAGGGSTTNNSFANTVNVNISGMKDSRQIRQAGQSVAHQAVASMQRSQRKNQ